MQALTLSVGVSVLITTNTLEGFINKQSKLPVQTTYSAVVDQSSEQIGRALPEERAGVTRVFACSLSDGTCISPVGGLSEQELRFFISCLWRGRKMMFRVQDLTNTTGWSYVLLLVWHCSCFLM
jgi:hypothetical protein